MCGVGRQQSRQEVVTKELLSHLQKPTGGFTRGVLWVLGVSCPPPDGWQTALIGTEISKEKIDLLHAMINWQNASVSGMRAVRRSSATLNPRNVPHEEGQARQAIDPQSGQPLGAKSMLVRGTLGRPFELALIDMTCDANGNYISDEILRKCLALNVPLFRGEILRPASFDAVERAFQEVEPASAVLVFAHGDGDDAAVTMADFTERWEIWSAMDLRLEGKLVELCVCESAFLPALENIIYGHTFALMLVAPSHKISGEEAIAFFPSFFGSLREQYEDLEPEFVEKQVDALKHLAGHKMRFSAINPRWSDESSTCDENELGLSGPA
jgi:hypothetical protein